MKKMFIAINKFISYIKQCFRPVIKFEVFRLHDIIKDQLFSIDEVTAEDLQLEDFLKKYDRNITSCGSEVFHHWLYSIKSKDQILQIQDDLKIIYKSDRPFLERTLKYVGKQSQGSFIRDLWNGFSIDNWVINHFYTLFLINLITCTILCILFTKLFIILFLINNFILYLLTNSNIYHISSSLGYFLKLCFSLSKIEKRQKLSLSQNTPAYKKFSSLFKQLPFFKEGIGGPNSGDIISILLDYLRIFLNMELFAYKQTEKFIKNNIKDVKEIYLYIGYMDCLLNTCHIMDENKCCFSKIIEKCEINFMNMNHPLLEDSVPQSRNVSKNLIITGLNMSGKTTFMKSLGLNQILATSFGFCFAENFSTCILNVLSSICINDELLNGKSRYYAEAERIVHIKELLEKSRCLCLIDEILSGTNSEERIYGSTRILNEFAKNESVLIAATHDTQIAENICSEYAPVYFDGEIDNDKIKFDYKIKEGIVSKKNGLLLLKLLGL
ncbi:MAG: hypothetical protein J6C25_00290 [Treponema sp.]|nr:hypothetical protein [Treponema sp.]MBP3561969.1 hypothetical protein [Treponema sp.]